jgi:hypothetical protein
MKKIMIKIWREIEVIVTVIALVGVYYIGVYTGRVGIIKSASYISQDGNWAMIRVASNSPPNGLFIITHPESVEVKNAETK